MDSLKKTNVLLFFIMLVSGIAVMAIGEPISAFLICSVIFIFIFKKAKYSFFSVFSFIMLFSYLQAVIHKVTGSSAGILNWAGEKVPFYFNEMTIATITLLLSIMFMVYFSKAVEHEKKLYIDGSGITLPIGVFFLIISVILVLLLFPSFPDFHMDNETRRTQGITKYYGFLLIALNLTALTLGLSFKYKFFNIFYAFIVFWVLGHGERVEILGFIILFALTYINRLDFSDLKKKVIKRKKKLIYIGAFLMLALMMYIGMTRMRDGQVVNISKIIENLIVQPTCGDVVYVFNCAIDMWKKGEGLYGYSYIDYPLQLFPGSTPQYQIAVVMFGKYDLMGGGLFFTEPMANFGIIGTIISNIEFCIVYAFFLRKPSKFTLFFWTPIVIEIFRTAWYGRTGWILSSFVILPFFYLFIRLFMPKKYYELNFKNKKID